MSLPLKKNDRIPDEGEAFPLPCERGLSLEGASLVSEGEETTPDRSNGASFGPGEASSVEVPPSHVAVSPPTETFFSLLKAYLALSLPGVERARVMSQLCGYARSGEVGFRRHLCRALADFPWIEWDLFVALIEEGDEISLSFLKKTSALDGRRMVYMTQSMGDLYLGCLAQRPDLTLGAAWIMIERGGREVIETLLDNEALVLDSPHYKKLYERFEGDDALIEKLLDVPHLPSTIRALEVKKWVDFFGGEISQWQGFSRGVGACLSKRCAERVLLDLLLCASPGQREALLASLMAHGQLTSALVLRAACLGRMDLVDHLLAFLLRVSSVTVRRVTRGGGWFVLRIVYWAARLPRDLFPIFYHAIEGSRRLEPAERLDGQLIAQRVVDAIMARGKKQGGQVRLTLLQALLEVTEGPVRAAIVAHLSQAGAEDLLLD